MLILFKESLKGSTLFEVELLTLNQEAFKVRFVVQASNKTTMLRETVDTTTKIVKDVSSTLQNQYMTRRLKHKRKVVQIMKKIDMCMMKVMESTVM